MSILEDILAAKRSEVVKAKNALSFKEIERLAMQRKDVRSFSKSLKGPALSVIAEIKRASPSRGELIKDFDHQKLARQYESAGARALSVLTDREFFKGSLAYLQEVRKETNLPLLRKDFIIDEYQVYESVVHGADAVLLIVAALKPDMLKTLYDRAHELGMEVLVEVSNRAEIEQANEIGAAVIGVNNRDLATFRVSLDRSVQLRQYLRHGSIAVSESGITTRDDLTVIKEAGFDAVLIGEGLTNPELRAVLERETV
jgi:indole-3-glycerol phosphate synthase